MSGEVGAQPPRCLSIQPNLQSKHIPMSIWDKYHPKNWGCIMVEVGFLHRDYLNSMDYGWSG